MTNAPASPTLELRRLSFRYPNGRIAVDDVSCCISAGERVAVVGPSGAGKSTLLMHLNGLLPVPAVVLDEDAQVYVQALGVTKTRLREELATANFSTEAGVQVLLESDPQILKAIESMAQAMKLVGTPGIARG